MDLEAAPETEADLEAFLLNVLDDLANVHPDDLDCDLATAAEQLDGSHVSTFDQHGVLTNNKGLVLRLRNGATFQLTLVQSEYAR